jgi:hypothetical protein
VVRCCGASLWKVPNIRLGIKCSAQANAPAYFAQKKQIFLAQMFLNYIFCLKAALVFKNF